MANNSPKKAKKSNEPGKEINLVSVSYKVGKNIFTAEALKKEKSNSTIKGSSNLREINFALENFEVSCGPNCRCVNGFKERLISFGGAEIWMRTNEPC
jgi:hypothetical protein